MKNRKRFISILAGLMAFIMLLSLILSLIPTHAHAASSSEIRKQINHLKEEKEEIQNKIKEVQAEYEENENEIANIIAKKNVIDQEIQLLISQISNMNEQLTAYNILIADKQEEKQLESLYASSYMIIDGKRIDDLQKIKPDIDRILAYAEQMEQSTSISSHLQSIEEGLIE